LKRCLKKECCKQCRYVKFQGTMTKWPVQKPIHRTTQKHVELQDAKPCKDTRAHRRRCSNSFKVGLTLRGLCGLTQTWIYRECSYLIMYSSSTIGQIAILVQESALGTCHSRSMSTNPTRKWELIVWRLYQWYKWRQIL